MKSLARGSLFAIALACIAGGWGAAAELPLRADEPWDKPVSLDLLRADARMVLELIFKIVEAPLTIDACVAGEVSLKFENVPVRDALLSVVRTLQLEVRPRSEGYYVGCAGHAAGFTGEPVVELDFELAEVASRSTVTRARLAVVPGERAELAIGPAVAIADIDDTGRFFSLERQQALELTVFVEPQGGGAVLRGIVTRAELEAGSLPVRRVVAVPFEVELPTGASVIEVARFESGGATHTLSVSRRIRQTR